MPIERILGTDIGKDAFYKTDRNFVGLEQQINTLDADVKTQLAQKADKKTTQEQLNEKRDKRTPISLNDAASDLLAAIQNKDGETNFNLLSVPRLNSVTPGTTTFIKPSSNLLNIDNLVDNKVININGEILDNQQYAYSHPINIQPNQEVFAVGTYHAAFYDRDDNFLLRVATDDIANAYYKAPENAYILRVNVGKTSIHYINKKVQVSFSSVPVPFEPYQLRLDNEISVYIPPITNDDLPQIEAGKLEFMEPSSNLFNIKDVVLGKVINNVGEIVDNENYGYSHPISVTPNTQVTLYGVHYAAFYDRYDNFVIRLSDGTGGETTLTVPDNCYIMRLDFMTTGMPYRTGTIQVNDGPKLLPFEPFGAKVKSEFIPADNTEKLNKFIFDTSLEGTFNSNRTFDDYTSNGWATNQSSDVYALVDALQAEHPNYISKQALTSDVDGNEIYAYHLRPERPQMSNQNPYPTIFIATGTHGYERSSVINVYHMIKEMCESWKEDELIEALRFNVNVIWMPIVNPHGWNAGGGAVNQRYNPNGIDIARQFPDDWVKQDPTSNTYGGEAPLTEVEALNVKQIFDENPGIDIFYDYHNFGNVIDEYIWLATASVHSEKIGEALIKKMSRKWSSDFTFIPEGKLVGYTSIMNQGTMHNYAYKSLGIERSGTFETNNQFHLDSDSVKYNQDSLKAGLESIVNFLIINLRDLIE